MTETERIEGFALWFVTFDDDIKHDFVMALYLSCSGFMDGYCGARFDSVGGGPVRPERWQWEAGRLARDMEATR